MERKIIKTADGSTTIYLPEWNEHYHSKHGAIQEANHVFVKNGLLYFIQLGTISNSDKKISILEIGFGTGLNAFITLLEAENQRIHIDYTGVEAYPISMDEAKTLNFPEALKQDDKVKLFENLHNTTWGEKHQITKYFNLEKQKCFFSDIEEQNQYNIIYFDAFGARLQPELWTESIFEKMFRALKRNGVLVTYSAKGSVRRAMLSVGFNVEKLPGPPGKREMLRATKLL